MTATPLDQKAHPARHHFRVGLFLLCLFLGGLLGGLMGLLVLPLFGVCWATSSCSEAFVWGILFVPLGVLGGLVVLGPLIYIYFHRRNDQSMRRQITPDGNESKNEWL
jgi:hypothetical protein